jgi:hypothetical protein
MTSYYDILLFLVVLKSTFTLSDMIYFVHVF